ncbi:hypothetical protein [Amycolatopsis sp. H20-H5]|uniref:hypothetical protein n=1 Tax=Amycolatopsis sp. H20-H5 TaxID=3046309 RepID=UPI002DB90D33|nr:hypothetical protein [Amycolatopsis sp. H20-H5]MEC3976194.1 hypothetical protein [Amycolatopsis sp. H20-H5]
MAIDQIFATTTLAAEPTSGHLGSAAPEGTKSVSDFVTVQSFANFAVMTGAITAAWGGAQQLWSALHGQWFPFALCLFFGLVSLFASQPGQTTLDDNGNAMPNQQPAFVRWLQPSFIMVVNTFVLYGAVLGASTATNIT